MINMFRGAGLTVYHVTLRDCFSVKINELIPENLSLTVYWFRILLPFKIYTQSHRRAFLTVKHDYDLVYWQFVMSWTLLTSCQSAHIIEVEDDCWCLHHSRSLRCCCSCTDRIRCFFNIHLYSSHMCLIPCVWVPSLSLLNFFEWFSVLYMQP